MGEAAQDQWESCEYFNKQDCLTRENNIQSKSYDYAAFWRNKTQFLKLKTVPINKKT